MSFLMNSLDKNALKVQLSLSEKQRADQYA